jgi:hypothetical protein
MKFAITVSVLALLAGCAGNTRPADAPNQTSTTGAPMNDNAPALQAGPTPAPDTQGGKPNEEPTGMTTYDGRDQSATFGDFRLTEQIRHDLMGDPQLSFMAKNVSILVNQNRVTLLGFVKNEQERQVVTAIAKKFAGDGAVEDRLRIQPSDPSHAP